MDPFLDESSMRLGLEVFRVAEPSRFFARKFKSISSPTIFNGTRKATAMVI
jgi:hypothetical protein